MVVAAHEALHRFFGDHGTTYADQGIMSVFAYNLNVDLSLTDEQFRVLQNTDFPR